MGIFGESKKKILVVEDEQDIAESIKLRLDMAGYLVTIVNNGKDAVLKAKSDIPDAIVLDIMIPKMDGYEVCKVIRTSEATKKIPVLVLTALQMVGDIDKAFEAGANDYLSKPFTNDKLLAKIEKLLFPPSK